MTNQEYSAFAKYAVEDSLASALALNTQRTIQRLSGRYGISPRTVSYGPTNMNISSGGSTYNRYLSSIMQQESSGKANVVNKSSGALGLYQFMPKTLRGLGYKGSFQDFLSDPNLQTSYMRKFTEQNAKALGIDINNMTSQQAGYLAAAHYGGVGGARKIMSGNRQYGTTAYYGKTPYSYMNDVLRRMYGK